MSKYDAKIDLSLSSSTGIIIDKIREGFRVLEFGCASGRMTRYMAESLHCRVSIVEYNRSDYEQALQYAVDGLCDDILRFTWCDRYAGERFDAILFVDVLEHLTRPEEVLARASELLKEDGRIYVSVPNVTHNDILLKMYEEHFDYTKVGLLDDTHVHFWGLENLHNLTGKGLLVPEKIEAIYRPTGESEQAPKIHVEDNRILKHWLAERAGGEVYQYIVTLARKDRIGDKEPEICLHRALIRSHIYLDTGAGFHDQELLTFESELTAPGTYTAHFVLEDTEGLQAVRLDPVEEEPCVLTYVSIRQGSKVLPLAGSAGAAETEKGLLLPGKDPWISAKTDMQGGPVIIDADILLASNAMFDILQEVCQEEGQELQEKKALCVSLQSERDRLSQERDTCAGELEHKTLQYDLLEQEYQKVAGQLQELSAEAEAIQKTALQAIAERDDIRKSAEQISAERDEVRKSAEQIRAERDRLQKEQLRLQKEAKNLQKQLDRLQTDRDRLQADLGAYITLANDKDAQLIRMETNAAGLQDEIAQLQAELADAETRFSGYVELANRKDTLLWEKEDLLQKREQEVREKEAMIRYYQNRRVVRLSDAIWRILRGIVRRLRRLTGKQA